MRLEVDGVRLFFDVQGAALRPDGSWLREVPGSPWTRCATGADDCSRCWEEATERVRCT
jgi:hypothetical protein